MASRATYERKGCSHCGSGNGYYTKEIVRGYSYMNFKQDGTPESDKEEQGLDMDSLLTVKTFPQAFCRRCHSPVFRLPKKTKNI